MAMAEPKETSQRPTPSPRPGSTGAQPKAPHDAEEVRKGVLQKPVSPRKPPKGH